MVSDEVLRMMCRRLIEGNEDGTSKWLDVIVSELIDRKLVSPMTSLEDQNVEAREFATAFLKA